MAGPIYEREGPGIITQVISTAIAILFIWQMITSGSLRGSRAGFIAVIPWLMVWFPDTAAGYLGNGIRGKMVSRVGWVIMLSLLIPLALFWLVP